jgi:DNA-binding transcriptional ArsR family regulator
MPRSSIATGEDATTGPERPRRAAQTRLPAPAGAPAIAALVQAAGQASALLKSLANPDRLLLLCHLVDAEANVTALETQTGIRQPTLSQQLGVLRDEGIVQTRRDGKFIYYRIASAPALAVLQTLHATFCNPQAALPTPAARDPQASSAAVTLRPRPLSPSRP